MKELFDDYKDKLPTVVLEEIEALAESRNPKKTQDKKNN